MDWLVVIKLLTLSRNKIIQISNIIFQILIQQKKNWYYQAKQNITPGVKNKKFDVIYSKEQT